MAKTIPEVFKVSVGAERVVAVDFLNCLSVDPDTKLPRELITSATVVEVGTAALTITSVGANSRAEWIRNRKVLIGGAVLFKVAGHQAAKYRLRVTANTNGTPSQKLVYDIILEGV